MLNYERICAQIDLDALGHNIRQIKSRINADTDLMAVVKADGYGHGAVEIAKQAIANGACCLGVAIIEEAIALRENKITNPILILGAISPGQIQTALSYNIQLTVFSYDMAKEISKTAAKMGLTAKIHIKVDTGMGRLGFLCDENGLKLVQEIFHLPGIEIVGIYTHLSCADSGEQSYTRKQDRIFIGFIEELKKAGCQAPKIHVSNSAAIDKSPLLNYDMVRAGILIYGLYPYERDEGNPLQLKPVMSLKAIVTSVKAMPKGAKIGYGATFTTERDSIIATIGAGYGDGYPRLLSGKGRVLIAGEYAPIAGRVCMDQFMVDVTELNGIRAGDEAVLLGRQGSHSIDAYEIASLCQTITHDVVCMVGKRVPRQYIKDGQVVKTLYL